MAHLVVQLQGGGGNRVEAVHKDCGLQVGGQALPGETGTCGTPGFTTTGWWR